MTDAQRKKLLDDKAEKIAKMEEQAVGFAMAFGCLSATGADFLKAAAYAHAKVGHLGGKFEKAGVEDEDAVKMIVKGLRRAEHVLTHANDNAGGLVEEFDKMTEAAKEIG